MLTIISSDLKASNLNAKDKLKLVLAVGSTVAVGYFAYLTVKIYLNHRKYRHIPGPPNKKG